MGSRTVLRGASFEFGTGITGLIGVNGAGKSTLMRILAGIQSPTSGRAETAEGVRVRMVPQDLSRVAWLTAAGYVRYAKFVARDVDGDPVAAVLESVGLQAVARTPLDRLSGGELRRLGIAVAAASRAQVLLLDEPTAGLDPLQRERVHDMIRELARDRAVLVSSHLSDDIERLVDSIALLNSGRVVFEGTLGELDELSRNEPGRSTIGRALAWAQGEQETLREEP